MNPFGKNINIKRRNDEPTEKEIFLEIVHIVDECWKRTNHMEEEMGMGVSNYEEPFYLVIENLVFLHYGEWRGHIILWWLFERLDDEGELLAIELNDQDKDTHEEVLVETPEQLWDLIRKIEIK
jgi:hypothetical protein